MIPARGNIVRRGDTGGFGLVVSNDMLHQVSGLVILCTVVRSETMAESFPNIVQVTTDDQHLFTIPVSIHTAPDSAVAEIVGNADAGQLHTITQILHAASGP